MYIRSMRKGSFRRGIPACALLASVGLAACDNDNLFELGGELSVPPPTVSYTISAPTVSERGGTVSLVVSAVESPGVTNVGATVVAVVRSNGASNLIVFPVEESGRIAAFEIPFSQFGIPATLDRGYEIEFEVHAFAIDDRDRCVAVAKPGETGTDPCIIVDGSRLAAGVSPRHQVTVVRSQTAGLASSSDRLVDIKTDGQRVFVSNFTKNRVEILPIGSLSFGTPIRVGSEPWGLAISPNGSDLFVANSGGTSISRISIGGSSLPAVEDANRRIQTKHFRVFEIAFDDISGEPHSIKTIAGDGIVEYSDRPQYIAQTASGTVLFSTRPAPLDVDRKGTLRRFNLVQNREELFRGDDSEIILSPIEVSADSARIIPGDGVFPATLKVCFGVTCYEGDAGSVIDDVIASDFGAQLGVPDYRPEFEYSDTTFIAVSSNYSTVVFGRSGQNTMPGAIFRFEDVGDGFSINYGNTADLVKNAFDRVLGLSLNSNGSLGIARGEQSYMFDRGLRLQGVVTTGTPTGGVALNPRQGVCPGQSNPECIAFVSGTDGGRPYIDVVDTYHFDSLRRIHLAEPVTGGIVAVPVGAANSSGVRFMLYGITPSGVVTVEIYPQDLVGPAS